MAGKRKAPFELTLPYDKRLTAVTRALDNLKRLNDGSALTSGSFDAFPLPLVRLAGDADDLPLPLTPLAIDVIARRAESSANNHTFIIKHQDVELRNPRWEEFVEKIVESTRVPLGITNAAKLAVTLKEVVLVRAGGHLPVSSADSTTIQKHGRFGSLVVVLPGEFSGGEVAMTLAGSSDMKVETQRWNPERTDRDAFDIAYAAFCNDVSIVKTTAVTSGHALCLVYDLATSVIYELPRYAGAEVLTNRVQSVLAAFFTVNPPPSKRAKITEDAWRTISEFATDHRLIYPVMANTFDELKGYEKQLFEQLARFCEHSNGQFALYLAPMGECSWNKLKSKDPTNYPFSLRTPWRRYGDRIELPFFIHKIQSCLEVGPAGFMERVDYRKRQDEDRCYHGYVCAYGRDDRGNIRVYDPDYRDDFYRPDYCYPYVGNTVVCRLRQRHALVVQPVTLDNVLWVEVSTEVLLRKLHELTTKSPTEAVRLARRFLAKQSSLDSTADEFARFLEVAMTLNDAPLFRDLLRSTTKYDFDDSTFARAIRVFGWDSCIETIERCIENLKSFRSRVNLVCSALQDFPPSSHIDRLMFKLKTVLPWAGHEPLDCTVDLYRNRRDEEPTAVEIARLLRLAHESSPATLQTLLEDSKASSLMVTAVIPSLVELVESLSGAERMALVPTLRSLHAMLASSLPVLRNAHYARCKLNKHCDRCSEIQAFLVSTVQQISLPVRNNAQRKHIETVVKRQIQYLGAISVDTTTSTAVVLTKESCTNLYAESAKRSHESLAALISS